MLVAGKPLFLGEPQRLGHADYCCDVLGAGAQATLLSAAVGICQHRGAALHIERTDTLRAVDLVPAE